ncbi:hypothetical protein [Microbacterium lacticum]
MGIPVSAARADAAPHAFASSLSPEEFKTLFRGHPGGVAVITADAGGGPVSLTASCISSIPMTSAWPVSERQGAQTGSRRRTWHRLGDGSRIGI